MEGVLGVLKMAQTAQSPGGTEKERKLPPIRDVRKAVLDFLGELPDVRRVNVTKLAVLDRKNGTWEAEADAFIPNATIRSLQLPTQKEVLDCKEYLLRLDRDLNVEAYGFKDSVER